MRLRASARGFAALFAILLAPDATRAQDLSVVRLEARQEGDRFRLLATNPTPVPVELDVGLATGENVSATPALPLRVVVGPGQGREVTVLRAIDARRGFRFNYRFTAYHGDPAARPDPAARYRMPFADGRRFQVSQAPGGPVITHDDPQTAMAIDIVMPEGTPVLAAREGRVVELFEKSATRGDNANRGNFVRVFHEDGTWADYAHLQSVDAALALNQRVTAGTVLGLSGNTGRSSGPHLHFHVQRNAGARVVSIPVAFATRSRGVVVPAYRMWLVAD